MSSPTSKQLSRASRIVAACENLRAGLAEINSVAFDASQDGITLTSADFSDVATSGGSSLEYLTGAQLDLVVSAAMQLVEAVGATIPNTGTPGVTIAQAIATVCGS